MTIFRTLILLLTTVFTGSTAYAANPNECDIPIPPAMLTYDVGEVFVPRDAPVGSIIGIRNYQNTIYGDFVATCSLNAQFTFNMLTGAALPQFTTANGAAGGGRYVYPSNIPGVGVAADLRYSGSWLTSNKDTRDFPVVMTVTNGSGVMLGLGVSFNLIKTGPIPSGTHEFGDLPVFNGFASGFSGTLVQGRVRGRVTQSECSLPPAPGNQIEVPLGEWEKRIFTGRGKTTDKEDFEITLLSCIAGSYPTGQPWNFFQSSYANIRFDGAGGSTIIDPVNGLLSLAPSATDQIATGLAIQILRADGSPMPLGRETQIKRLNDGVTMLPFSGRYYQTDDKVTVGLANGTANFTVTYK
jgi:type 1 fimbria pilin